MKLAIMQPYLFPYIGYFQLMNAVDEFVLYDNIEFTKKGWINRNRILVNGKAEYFTLPLKKGSDYLNIDQRKIADTFSAEKIKLLRRMSEAYRKAPYFETVFPGIQNLINSGEENLFRFTQRSIEVVCKYLDITTKIIISSTLPIDHGLKAQDKVLAICKALNATRYINPIGGLELYNKDEFKNEGIDLQFLQTGNISYDQFESAFVPALSIIDVMMFNSKEKIKEYLNADFTLL